LAINPELGFANATDVFSRVKTNVGERTAVLAEILTAHLIYRFVRLTGRSHSLVLSVVGVADSLLGEIGEDILAWYFLGFEFIYILWPLAVRVSFLRTLYLAVSSLSRLPERWAVWSFACTAPVGRVPLAACACSSLAWRFVSSWAAGPSWSVGVQIEFLVLHSVSAITSFRSG